MDLIELDTVNWATHNRVEETESRIPRAVHESCLLMDTSVREQRSFGFEGDTSESPGSTDAPIVVRPVQYLGNKLRSLPDIMTAARSLLGDGSIVDLFSGTSVVSQALATFKRSVTSVDTQLACQTMATALLGVGRRNEVLSSMLVSEIVRDANALGLHKPWARFLDLERTALLKGDHAGIAAINGNVPLIWNRHIDFEPLTALLSASGKPAVGIAPLFALTLTGSYFGVRQALEIDSLRWAIEYARKNDRLTQWQSAALLTALMTAMSKAVHSAGKHFAQPLTAGGTAGFKFRTSRMMQDRKIDIIETFSAAAEMIALHSRPGNEDHSVLGLPAEDALSNLRVQPTLIYADPPYTAQQYSRFYHALETLITYEAPGVETETAKTSGLYPINRYKSAFCSKKRAPAAFEQLITAAHSHGASLILSYSSSARNSTGNDRMISLNDILEMCKRHYGERSTSVIELKHSYRQFNSERNSNANRSDPELLIACRS